MWPLLATWLPWDGPATFRELSGMGLPRAMVGCVTSMAAGLRLGPDLEMVPGQPSAAIVEWAARGGRARHGLRKMMRH